MAATRRPPHLPLAASRLVRCPARPAARRHAEAEFCSEQAASRWRVLALVGGFDCAMFVVRAAAKAFSGEALGRSLLLQLGNMVALYSAMALLNSRSRRGGSRAAQQVRRGRVGEHACRRRAMQLPRPPRRTSGGALV